MCFRNGHKVDKHPVLERKSKSYLKIVMEKKEVQIKPKIGEIIGPL
jgi:hypothetical protein